MKLLSRRLLAAFVLVTAAALGISAPAQAAVPGSVSPIINVSRTSTSYSAKMETTGWAAKGTIKVFHRVYIGPTSNGPWTEVDNRPGTCYQQTYCSTAAISGTCAGAWVKVSAWASRNGVDAENNGASRVKQIGSSSIARAADSSTASATDATVSTQSVVIDDDCRRVFEGI